MTAQVNAIIPSSLLLVLMWNKHDLTSRAWCNQYFTYGKMWLKWLVNKLSLSISFTLSPKNTARFSAVPDERLASWNNRGNQKSQRLFHDASLSSGTAVNHAVCLGFRHVISVQYTAREMKSREEYFTNITLYTHYILLYLLVIFRCLFKNQSFKKPLCKWLDFNNK